MKVNKVSKVKFNSQVIVRHLVQPDIIYFCKKPVIQELKDCLGQLIRVHAAPDQFSCACSPCLKGLNNCKNVKCPQCIIKCDQFDQWALSTSDQATSSSLQSDNMSCQSGEGAITPVNMWRKPEQVRGSTTNPQLAGLGSQEQVAEGGTQSHIKQARTQRL